MISSFILRERKTPSSTKGDTGSRCHAPFLPYHEMLIAGATYWNMCYGQMPGDVLKDQEGMNNMRSLGRNMAYLLKALHKEENE